MINECYFYPPGNKLYYNICLFSTPNNPIHQTETIEEMLNGWYQTMYYILYYILILLDFIIQKYLKVNKIDLKYIQLNKYIYNYNWHLKLKL